MKVMNHRCLLLLVGASVLAAFLNVQFARSDGAMLNHRIEVHQRNVSSPGNIS
ncbi:MAG: hypothetical protein AB1540_14910 [Bdellovibrionota bacterium]